MLLSDVYTFLKKKHIFCSNLSLNPGKVDFVDVALRRKKPVSQRTIIRDEQKTLGIFV